MQHYVINNFSYTSQQRQQRIFNDINSIIMLISAYKKSLKSNQNKQLTQSFAKKTFQIKNLKQSQISLSQTEKQYAQYGKKFQQLSYSQLLYLLCRKQVLHEFIQSFIEEKYQTKNLSNFHQNIVENIHEIINNISPQISLSACIDQNWINILSKQDIFDDTLDLLKSNISKNWKVNHIKVQKKLQNSILLNEGSKIFQTEPNLDEIQVNPAKNPIKIKSKEVIQQSTRQILKGLQKLKKQMEQCQAEMNMAKNNDNRILEKSQQYSNKNKQYNQLKQIYRKRTINKQQNQFKQTQKRYKQTIINETNLKQNLSNDFQKINSIVSDDYKNQFVKQIIVAGQDKSVIDPQNSKELLKQKPLRYQVDKQQTQILNQSIILQTKQQLSPEDYNELIKILDQVKKNQQKNQRIQTLAAVQNQEKKTPINQLAQLKNIHKNRRDFLVSSSKQQFLDKYVRKVFNHYILEQSKMKHLSLFDKNLSSSELNFSHTDSQKNKGNTQIISPSMRKKFSVQIEQSTQKQSGKRRMSLINPAKVDTSYLKHNKLRQRMKTIGNSLSQHQSLTLKQPQLSLESYSKFIKAFELSTKTVTLSQILHLFKKKSNNKKSITYHQFLQLFQLIYRLECQKMEIEFTPLMFDNYLKKQIFSWDKINKVLRLKTIGVDYDSSKGIKSSQLNVKKTSNNSKKKISLVGHSGRLSEEIMQKINSTKKPFDKMPCMNRNKTLPIGFEDDLPMTRIQIKIEQMKRLKEIQKSRKKQQLQVYLLQSRMRENDLQQLQQDFQKQNNKSYSKRYRMMEHKKRKTNEIMKNLSKDKSKLINFKKLQQDNNRYINNQSQTSNGNKNYNNLDSQKQIQVINKGKNKRRAKTLQPSCQTIQSENYNAQQKKSQLIKKNIQSHQEIIELQKIIGIRQSDQQSQYSQEFQQDYEPRVNQKHSRIKEHSFYQTIDESQKNIAFDQIRKQNKKQFLLSQNSNKKVSLKNKNRQQDEFLAHYFSQQKAHISPIRYLQSGTQNLQKPDNESLPNGRQNWRIHF